MTKICYLVNMLSVLLAILTLSSSLPARAEDLNEVICPQIALPIIKNSQGTFSAIKDYLQTITDERSRLGEFKVTLLELKKTNLEHEKSAMQIEALVKGFKQKKQRAKENYNEQLKQLAINLPRAKKCWSYHKGEEKELLAAYLQAFQKDKALTQFKACIKQMQKTNEAYVRQTNSSLRFFNQSLNKTQLIAQLKKEDEWIKKSTSVEEVICKDFTASGKLALFLDLGNENLLAPTPVPKKKVKSK